MAVGVIIDHLDAIPSRMRHENAVASRFKGSVVEQGAGRIGNVDDAHCFKRQSQSMTWSATEHYVVIRKI